VPAALIVTRIHEPPEPRFDLETDDVRIEHGGAGRAAHVTHRQERRDERRTRVSE
jgi:hypothetical protein